MVHHRIEPSDAALLELLTSDPPATNTSRKFVRRDAALDPLLLAAAAASGPHMTRNHYAHDFYPAVQLQSLQPQLDWTTWTGTEASATKEDEQKRGQARLVYKSRQAPRRERLGLTGQKDALLEKTSAAGSPTTEPESPTSSHQISTPSPSIDSLPAVEVKCMARTRIPTPHGPVFLHLYHNNRDNKEHLALVVDPAQLADQTSTHSHIRSSSLDSKWSSSETNADRLLRGAYVGKLSSTSQHPSRPIDQSASVYHDHQISPPLIRIHSECFTGETIGSMRCDCGEQLDEAIRQIARSQTLPTGAVIPGRGAVIYMRQEGRGIGLLSKIRAYNLQDMGHDTVTANLMLGHQADERRYDVAAAILRDLGLGSGVRVLTNNPDKLQALEYEGLTVLERVPMIPRSWQQRYKLDRDSSPATPPELDTPGATMIGGSAVSGPDLDKYLRTKVLRMGHILPLWMDGVEA